MAPVAGDCKWWPAWNRGGAPPPPGREAAPRRAPRQVCAGEALAPYLPVFDFAAQPAIPSAWGPDTRPLASTRSAERALQPLSLPGLPAPLLTSENGRLGILGGRHFRFSLDP